MKQRTRKRIVIIGAGSAGLCMGVQLKKAGIDDFVILEKGGGIGAYRNSLIKPCGTRVTTGIRAPIFRGNPGCSCPMSIGWIMSNAASRSSRMPTRASS